MTARKSIFDIIKSKYDTKSELLKVNKLFSSKLIGVCNRNNYSELINVNWCTLENISDHYFKEWDARESCIDTKEMKELINLDERLSNIQELDSEFVDVDDIVHCLEYYINIIILAKRKYINPPNEPKYQLDSKYQLDNKYDMLLENIEILLDKIHHESKYSEETEKLILIPKNPAATSVAESSSDETGMAILMYHHRQLKGNIEGKRQLLLTMANEYEPLLKKEFDGFKDYFSKTRELLNKLNIRHNNGDNEFLNQMSESDLEGWYDETYQLILFCVLIKDNAERKSKAKDILKKINQKDSKPDATIDKQ